jgi:hypothetical protein
VTRRKHTKLIHEGDYVAEVEVELMDSDEGWGPYLSLDKAYKLDRVRAALRKNDLAAALPIARIYRLTPIQPAG